MNTGNGKISSEFWAILGIGIPAVAFLWSLHNDVADVRERMARMEGLMEGFIARPELNKATLEYKD